MSAQARLAQVAARAGRICRWFERPADFWLAARMATWAAALRVLKFLVPLPTLARWVAARPQARPWPARRREQVSTMARWLCHPGPRTSPRRCLERSLLAFRYLGRAGAQPVLVIGLRRDGAAVQGHAWVTVADVPVGESPAALAAFVPILAFGARGTRQMLPGPG